MEKNFYPSLIRNLPEADVRFPGVKAWISQSEIHQIVFFEIEASGVVEPHSHGEQWGIVLEGELELTIGGIVRSYRKGDSYHIPAGVIHSAVVNQKSYVMDFFADKDRYKTK